MKATYFKHTLQFKQASGTSRGILTHKDTWFILLEEKSLKGIGECGMFKGLSIDDCDGFELKLKWACLNIDLGLEVLLSQLVAFPSIQFGGTFQSVTTTASETISGTPSTGISIFISSLIGVPS